MLIFHFYLHSRPVGLDSLKMSTMALHKDLHTGLDQTCWYESVGSLKVFFKNATEP